MKNKRMTLVMTTEQARRIAEILEAHPAAKRPASKAWITTHPGELAEMIRSSADDVDQGLIPSDDLCDLTE